MTNHHSIRVGVIGGGQLARMMVPAAINLGLEISVLAETSGASAQRAADQVGDYRDPATVYAFAATVDVVTFDHEHVPPAILRELIARGVAVHPAPQALQYAQDKLLMRQKLSDLQVPMPEWAAVYNEQQLQDFIACHGGSAVVKTPRGGYDGKGVRVVSSAAEVRDWFAQAATDAHNQALLVEELVDFRRELSQLIARSPAGEMRSWPVVETVQSSGVCTSVIAPAAVADPHNIARAAQIGETIAAGLDVTGVLAVEMFETTSGKVLVNELAMRPHNSGHFSIEGSITSQFEQHLRAVCDLPLGDTALTAPHAVMVNVLGGTNSGAMVEKYHRVLAQYPRVKVHNYGKAPRPGRKLGHVTVTGGDLAEVTQLAHAAAQEFA